MKQWQIKNRKKCRDLSKRWRLRNPKKSKDLIIQWQLKHPKYWNKYKKTSAKWRKNNYDKVLVTCRRAAQKVRSTLKGNLNSKMACAILRSLKTNKAGRQWESLVGYTVGDLKTHLELLFTGSMTWKLFMQGKIHIDHVIPKSFFQYDKPEDQEFQYCWSLDNLQPLWAKDNQSKSNKIIGK